MVRPNNELIWTLFLFRTGECTKDADDLLRSHRLQEPPKVEGDSVQKVSGVQVRPGGRRRYDRKQQGFGGQSKPILRKKVIFNRLSMREFHHGIYEND